MSKELMGATVKGKTVSITYRVTTLGQSIVRTKEKDISAEVVDAGVELVRTADILTPEVEDIVGVQVYTTITDNGGAGELLDLIFKDGNSIRIENFTSDNEEDNTKLGDLAKARDKFKDAIIASL